VVVTDRVAKSQPRERGTCPEHFEKALEAPCPFHRGQLKHLIKDYATMKGYIRGALGQ
jgi:hypothetical protein